ncbi:ABC-type arginine transport system permease subunit [Staphylococcus pasteuri]|nr:hypothetical protein CD121_05730 [Staphylococcus pasteuri]
MNFVIYPLILGLICALSKVIDIWYAKKVTKTYTRSWRFNPHLIWIMFIIGVIMGVIYVLFVK